MQNIMSRLRRLVGDNRGSVAILFALSALVIVLTIGLAIDGARAYSVSTRVGSALDAAALAGAKMFDNEDYTDADIEDRAQRFFSAHFTNVPVAGITVPTPVVTVTRATGEVDVAVNVSVATTFGQLAGISQFNFPRSTRVRYDQKRIELAMVVDITGSMCDPCDKIEGLKSAARELVANMINPQVPYGLVRIGIVPYSASVNAGPYAAAASGGASTDNCVVERPGAPGLTDMPASGNPLGTSDAGQNHKYVCSPTPIMAMTADRSTLETHISGLVTDGWTAGHIGLGWGWYMISHAWADFWPVDSRPRAPAANVIKAVLLMTDGEFNTSYIPGAGLNETDVRVANSSPEQTARLCANMKAQNVVVYTVAFQAPGQARHLLEDCATSRSHFFRADDAGQLGSAFRTIAERLSALRVTL